MDPRHSPAVIRAAALSMRLIKCAGGEIRISQVLLNMELGIRRIALTAVDARPTGSAISKLAAGGRGERAGGEVCEMATEVVAARWRIGVLEREDVFHDAAEDQELARELVSESESSPSSFGDSASFSDDPGSSSLLDSEKGVLGVFGVLDPLPTTAPTEFLSHTAAVGVVVKSDI